MHAPTNVYVDNEIYAELRAEVAAQLLSSGHHDPDTEAVHVLGEIRGVWPKSIEDDAEAQLRP